jgi:hypothetical protein
MALYLRDEPTLTLRGLADELTIDTRQWGGVTSEIEVKLNGEQMTLAFGGHEVPATVDGIEAFCTFMSIPRNFYLGLDLDMQQELLAELLHRRTANLTLHFRDDGVYEAHPPRRVRIAPQQVAEVAIKKLGEDARVVDWWCDDDLRIDVTVPDDFDVAIGGDWEVGDITRGGLRFTQSRKNNLAPAVNSYLYRLVCTNGMEVPETGTRVEARGGTVESVLAELELAADHAFRQVEEQIRHFYNLRTQRIEGDVTQAVVQIAAERGLPESTQIHLAHRVPSELDVEELGHEVSMFDVINLITNMANDPRLRHRRGPRRALESAGGTLVQHEADRCSHCHQVLAS